MYVLSTDCDELLKSNRKKQLDFVIVNRKLSY
jgi:hypothetical protein